MLANFIIMLSCLLCGQSAEEPELLYLKRSAPSWAKDLGSSDAKVRRAAAFAMGKLGKSALPHLDKLKTAMADADLAVRSTTATALGELAPLATAEVAAIVLPSFAQEKELTVRRSLILAVGKLSDRAASKELQLRQSLQDADGIIRQNAAWALGQLGKAAEPAIPSLMQLLNDKDAAVRTEAVNALGNLGTLAQEAIPGLVMRLEDNDSRVQEAAVLALRKMGPSASSGIASLLTIAETDQLAISLRQASLITIETVWPTGLKEPASWNRLQALARSAKEEAVKTTAQQTEKKVAALR